MNPLLSSTFSAAADLAPLGRTLASPDDSPLSTGSTGTDSYPLVEKVDSGRASKVDQLEGAFEPSTSESGGEAKVVPKVDSSRGAKVDVDKVGAKVDVDKVGAKVDSVGDKVDSVGDAKVLPQVSASVEAKVVPKVGILWGSKSI